MSTRRAVLLPMALAVLASGLGAYQFFPGNKKDKDQPITERSVQGAVHDPSDSLVEGAVVQVKNTKTLQIRSFITKADGNYHFHGLSTNVDYELKADFKNMASPTKTLSVFDNRRTATINLKLEQKK
jgi:hypothetical protein